VHAVWQPHHLTSINGIELLPPHRQQFPLAHPATEKLVGLIAPFRLPHFPPHSLLFSFVPQYMTNNKRNYINV